MRSHHGMGASRAQLWMLSSHSLRNAWNMLSRTTSAFQAVSGNEEEKETKRIKNEHVRRASP